MRNCGEARDRPLSIQHLVDVATKTARVTSGICANDDARLVPLCGWAITQHSPQDRAVSRNVAAAWMAVPLELRRHRLPE